MEEMKNCPCLDAAKLIEGLKLICGNHGYDFKVLMPAIIKANIGWFSRSMATALFVYCQDEDGDWCVLASERGKEAADFVGMWNCPCGYLDFNETAKECAVRECFEETGVKIDPSYLTFIGYEDNPVTANRQNVTFRFGAWITDRITTDFKFSKEGNEGEEVGEIKWVKVNDIDNYEWAFNHKSLINEIYFHFLPYQELC